MSLFVTDGLGTFYPMDDKFSESAWSRKWCGA